MAEARTCTTPPSHETVGVRVVALLGLLLAVLLTLPAGAASRHACRRQCSAFLAGCGGTRKQVRRCRRMIIRTCRRAGLAACLQTTTTSGRSTSTSTTTMPLLSLVGLVPGVGTASDIVVDGTTHRAYVASREFGLSVVNVSTPSAPMVIGASNPPFYGQRVAVAGTLAVGTAGRHRRLCGRLLNDPRGGCYRPHASDEHRLAGYGGACGRRRGQTALRRGWKPLQSDRHHDAAHPRAPHQHAGVRCAATRGRGHGG